MTLRNFLALIAALVDSFIIIVIVEYISVSIYPLPINIDPTNPDTLKDLMNIVPIGALFMILLAYALGSFTGSIWIGYICRVSQVRTSMVFATLLMAAAITNMLSIPHPVWFWIISLLLFHPMAYLGLKTGLKLQTKQD